MASYNCPLCGQVVTRNLYEKITGIWKEKEELMTSLKEKEKKLFSKEKAMEERLEKER